MSLSAVLDKSVIPQSVASGGPVSGTVVGFDVLQPRPHMSAVPPSSSAGAYSYQAQGGVASVYNAPFILGYSYTWTAGIAPLRVGGIPAKLELPNRPDIWSNGYFGWNVIALAPGTLGAIQVNCGTDPLSVNLCPWKNLSAVILAQKVYDSTTYPSATTEILCVSATGPLTAYPRSPLVFTVVSIAAGASAPAPLDAGVVNWVVFSPPTDPTPITYNNP